MTDPTSRVSAAVGRALDDRQREATEEVERILTATVLVIQRVAPEPPRTVRRYVGSGHRLDRADVDHLVAFCLRGLGAGQSG